MSSPAQINVVQVASAYAASGNNLPVALLAPTAAGNLIVVAIGTPTPDNSVTGVTDDAAGGSNTYAQVPGSPVVNGGNQQIQFFYTKNAKAAQTIAAAYPSTPSEPWIMVWEVQNADTTSPCLTLVSAATTSSVSTLTTRAFDISTDCLMCVACSVHAVGNIAWQNSLNSAGIIFDRTLLRTTSYDSAIGGAGHTFFAGATTGNTGVGVATGNKLSAGMAVVGVAFKAASGMGVKANVVCDGDSITYGAGLTTPWTSSLSLNFPSHVLNMGVPREMLATMVSNAAANIDCRQRKGMINVVTVWGGTNDFALNGSSLAMVEGLLSTYGAARVPAGWNIVLAVNMVDRGSVNNAAITAPFNNWMEGPPLPAGFNAIIVLPPSLIGNGANANRAYFQDTIHPTQFAATSVIAPAISTVIARLVDSMAHRRED